MVSRVSSSLPISLRARAICCRQPVISSSILLKVALMSFMAACPSSCEHFQRLDLGAAITADNRHVTGLGIVPAGIAPLLDVLMDRHEPPEHLADFGLAFEHHRLEQDRRALPAEAVIEAEEHRRDAVETGEV